MSVHTAYCASSRVDLGGGRDRTLHEAGHHHGAEAELGRVLELVDGLVRRVHRDLGDREQPIGELGEHAGVEPVERAARAAPVALVVEVPEQESEARVDHADVDAQLGEALVEQAGEHRGGAVDRELHAAVAPRAPGDPAVGALLGGEPVPVDDGPEGARRATGHRLAVEADALLDQLAGQRGEELDGVAVDVDHRVVELLADVDGAEAAHAITPSPDSGIAPSNARSSNPSVTIDAWRTTW